MSITYQYGTVQQALTTIDLAVKRYDSGTGSATFNGVVPLQPGQVEEAEVTNLALFESDVQIPILVNTLDGRHKDGSVRAIQVQTDLTVNDANPVTLEMRLGVAPSAGTVTEIDPDRSWCRNPTLLYCTDADHLCASRVAPMPLVPLDDPAMPAATATFLNKTNFLDGWLKDWENASGRNVQDAMYNWVYATWCHYLCTGDPDVYQYGLYCMMTYNSEDQGLYGGGNGSANARDISDFTSNKSGYNPYGDMTTDGGSIGQENNDVCMDAWAGYYGTGSLFMRGVLSAAGRQWFWHLGNSFDPTSGDAYTYRVNEAPRYAFRRNFTPHVWTYISGDDEARLDQGNNGNINPSTYYAPGGTRPLSEKVDQAYERANDVNMPLTWQEGVWGFSADTNGDSACSGNIEAVFQLEIMYAAFLPYYNWMDEDTRIGPGLQSCSEFIYSQWQGPHTLSDGESRFVQKTYCSVDPATVNTSEGGSTGAQSALVQYAFMNMHSQSWLYAYNGDTTARDAWDKFMEEPNPGIAAPHWKTRKLTGQIFAMAYHGAAWRAGAPALGY